METNCNNHIEDEPFPKLRRKDVNNKVCVVLGAQWGDEGKGKIVDLLSTSADIVCRVQVNYRVLVLNYSYLVASSLNKNLSMLLKFIIRNNVS